MSQVDEIGPWSEDKLELLRKYLNAYTTIMHNQEWCRGYHYIDAFAGTGRPRARDEERYIDGSPRVALNVTYPFHSYTFIEKDLKRVQRLQELKIEYPRHNIVIFQANCNDVLVSEVIPQIRFRDFQRGLIFLDPFGMAVEWETIEKIAHAQSLEVFINFPVMAINRSVLHNDPFAITETDVERMNRFWGVNEWRDDIYEARRNLWGEIVEFKPYPTTGDRLGRMYKERLLSVFPYVTDPLVMVNSKNAPLYCLIFAGHNDTGAKIVQDIFRRYKKLGH